MRKALAVLAAALMLMLGGFVGPAPEEADAACFTVGCFNKQISKLKRQVRSTRAQLNGFLGCLRVAPLTSYYGYWYDDPPFFTTAMDFTESGSTPDGWALFNACQTATASVSAAAASIGAFPRLDEPGKPEQK